MNSQTNRHNLQKLRLFFINSANSGYSLVEIIILTFVLGILAAVAVPKLNFNDPTADSYTQLKGILQQVRGRAISTTTAIRVKPDPNQPDNKLIVERANARGCDSVTRLSAAVTSSDQDLPVYSATGFQVGDELSVGGDSSNNEITGITGATITIGIPLGSSQPVDSVVELLNNWQTEGSISDKDLTLAEEAQVTSNISDWTLCFNSRGIGFIYDSNSLQQNSLVLTISNSRNSITETVTVLKGGAIQ